MVPGAQLHGRRGAFEPGAELRYCRHFRFDLFPRGDAIFAGRQAGITNVPSFPLCTMGVLFRTRPSVATRPTFSKPMFMAAGFMAGGRFCFGGGRASRAYAADLITDNLVIVEIKSVEVFAPVHRKLTSDLSAFSGKALGLLINFNAALIKDGISAVI
jgi:hypothetical protein